MSYNAGYRTNDSGLYRTNENGLYVTDFSDTSREIDYYDSERGRSPYTGSDRDISDLWQIVEKDFATSGSQVFEVQGFNVDGSPTPHSGVSLPKRDAEKFGKTQDGFLPYYPKPGDSFGADIWMGNSNGPTYRLMFGVMPSRGPEYLRMLQVNFHTASDEVRLCRETGQRGRKIIYDRINLDNNYFNDYQRYSFSIDLHRDWNFTTHFDGKSASTRNDSREVPSMGLGVGYECSSHGLAWFDTFGLL